MVVGIITYVMSKMEENDYEWSPLAEILGTVADIVLYYFVADMAIHIIA